MATSVKKNKDLVKVGMLIKLERKKKKYTLAQLSKLAFAHENYATLISEVERGLKPQVNYITIVKIFRALEVKLF